MAENQLTQEFAKKSAKDQTVPEPSSKPKNADDLKSNREYRSTVFTSYFSIPEHAAKLYEGLAREYDLGEDDLSDQKCGSDAGELPGRKYGSGKSELSEFTEVSPGDIVFTTLDGVLYMARKNDLAFTVKQKILVIGEHQATVNENMPLRVVIYFGRTMERLIPPRAIYRTGRIPIPTPEFYVFYNGKEPRPREQILSLSDSYLVKTDSPMLELKVKVINVNLSAGHPILQECRPLYEYSCFMGCVQDYLKTGENRDEAIRQAIEDCVSRGIMADYLQEHGSEVRNMLFAEFNLDDAKEVWQEEAWEKGRAEGEAKGKAAGKDEKLTELICKKLRKKKDVETIAEELEEDLPKIKDICRIAAPFAPDYDIEKVLKALG